MLTLKGKCKKQFKIRKRNVISELEISAWTYDDIDYICICVYRKYICT